MKYTEQFIAKVKRIYPNSIEMHRAAENNNAMLGRWLDDSCSNSIEIDWLLKQSDIIVIHLRCEEQKEKVALYKEWCTSYL